MKNSKLFLKIPETAQNFPTETWMSQKFPNPSDFPAQTKNSQFGILKSQFGYPGCLYPAPRPDRVSCGAKQIQNPITNPIVNPISTHLPQILKI